MLSYLKLALKVLGRRKFFTFISLFGITLTLAVLMIATAILDNIFSPRAPESRFDRVLMVDRITQYGPNATMSSDPGYAFIERWVRTLPGVERVAAYTSEHVISMYVAGRQIEARLKRTDGAYWQILDFRFLEGHPFTAADDEAGRRVAVISDSLRDRLFGGGPAVGKSVTVDGESFRVVGVVPRVPLPRRVAYAEIWVPIGTIPSSDYRKQLFGDFDAIVLARSRADFPRLKREFATRMARFPIDNPKEITSTRAWLDTPYEAVAHDLAPGSMRRGKDEQMPLIFAGILALIAILFMTLPALNLVTLNLSRILERASEIGVRRAFGAPRTSLVGQFVLENVVLTIIGGVIGFVVAAAALPAIERVQLVSDLYLDLNLRIFAYGMLVAAFFGVFSGFYPAWKMSRLEPVNALRGGTE